jgi:hypothetical protein
LPACPSHKGNMKMDEDDVRMLTVAGWNDDREILISD